MFYAQYRYARSTNSPSTDQDARTPYAENGKKLWCEPGTIHVRVEKMRQSGLIEGTKAIIDERKLGYDVCCFIGIILKSAKDYEKSD